MLKNSQAFQCASAQERLCKPKNDWRAPTKRAEFSSHGKPGDFFGSNGQSSCLCRVSGTVLIRARLDNPYSRLFSTLWAHFAPKFTFILNFHRMWPACSQVCRTALVRSALESSDHFGLILWRLMSSRHLIIQNFLERALSINFQFCASSQNYRIGSDCLNYKVDPPVGAPGSALSSALWLGAVRHIRDLKHIFWK